MLKFWQFQLTLIFHILFGEKLKKKMGDLDQSIFLLCLTLLNRLLKIMESLLRMKTMVYMEQLWEDCSLLTQKELSDQLPLMTNKLEEMLMKHSELFKLSNMLMNMESYAPPVGNQDQKLSSQINKKWKNTSKIYDYLQRYVIYLQIIWIH